VSVKVPVRVPVAVGVNVTLMVQLAPTLKGVTPIGQLFVWLKSPLMPKLLIVMGPSPVLVSVNASGALEVPTDWTPNVRLVGEKVASGPMISTIRETVAVRVKLPLLAIRVTGNVPTGVGVPEVVGLEVIVKVAVPLFTIEVADQVPPVPAIDCNPSALS